MRIHAGTRNAGMPGGGEVLVVRVISGASVGPQGESG